MVAALDLACGDRCLGSLQPLAPGAAAFPGLAVSAPLPFVKDHGRAAAVSAVRCPSHAGGKGRMSRGSPTSDSRPPIQDGLHDVGREEGEPKQRAEVSPLDLLRAGHLADGCVPPLVEQPLVPERTGQSLDRCRISPRREGRLATLPHRHHHRPPPRPPTDGQRHPDRDAGRLAHAAARLASGVLAPRSRTRLISPATRSRMSAPAGPTSTRSTSSRTIRACSAENSSSQSGSSRSSASRTSASVRSGASARAASQVAELH